MEHAFDDEAVEEKLTLISTNEPTKTPMHNAYLFGSHLRQQLQLTENMSWPPEPELCSNEYAASIIPTILFNLVSWIVTGD